MPRKIKIGPLVELCPLLRLATQTALEHSHGLDGKLKGFEMAPCWEMEIPEEDEPGNLVATNKGIAVCHQGITHTFNTEVSCSRNDSVEAPWVICSIRVISKRVGACQFNSAVIGRCEVETVAVPEDRPRVICRVTT